TTTAIPPPGRGATAGVPRTPPPRLSQADQVVPRRAAWYTAPLVPRTTRCTTSPAVTTALGPLADAPPIGSRPQAPVPPPVRVRCQSPLSAVRTNRAANDVPAATAGLSVAVPPRHSNGPTARGTASRWGETGGDVR